MIWLYRDSNEEQYRFEDEKFFQMVSGNVIGPDTVIWTEGMEEWLPASRARPEFFGESAHQAAPGVPRSAPSATPPLHPSLKRPQPPPPPPPPPTAVVVETSSAKPASKGSSAWSAILGLILLIAVGAIGYGLFTGKIGSNPAQPGGAAQTPEPEPSEEPSIGSELGPGPKVAEADVAPSPKPAPIPNPQPPVQPAAAGSGAVRAIESLADAGSSLRIETEPRIVIEAANFIADNAPTAERENLARPLAQALKPHLRGTEPRTRERVARALAFVASRDDEPALIALCDFDLDKDRLCVGYGMAGLLRVVPLRARSIYEQRRGEPNFKGAVLGALRDCKQEDWVHPLLEIRNVAIFEEACAVLAEIGTSRSAGPITRAAGGLWPVEAKAAVSGIAGATVSQLQQTKR